MQHIPLENVFLPPKVEEGAHNSSEQEIDHIPHHHDIHYKNPDVDGGWAYVVLVAMFCSFFINAGLLSTVGVYYVQFLEYFGKDRSHTSWIGSLMNAFFMLVGPLSSSCQHRFGNRTALLIGGIVMTAGFFASAFTPSLELLFFTYGTVVACGMNFVYTGQITALNIYFDKHQYIATSISMVGIGMGMFLVTMWTEYNIENNGWRVALIWNAGLSLQLLVFGSLVYPLHYPLVTSIKPRTTVSSPFSTALVVSHAQVSLSTAKITRISTLKMSAEASYASNFSTIPDKLLESSWNLFQDVCFWLIAFAFFFAMLSTISFFIIYKDFLKSKGFADQYTLMLIGFGVGDVAGRLSMGIAHSNKFFNPVWSYCVSLFLTGLVLICHIFINTLPSMHILGTLFGIVYGAQNALVAITPVKLFGKDNLVVVFGHMLFWGGIGALFGAPIAGAIVDRTGSYDVVLGLALVCLLIGAGLMVVCAVIDGKRALPHQQ